ncbi:GNAT family N-acetyltransferase [Streptomyces sp. NPDC048639]|uniref:GNAT family N-acetyltransferase n=1 Tax=Streptomyces sp. NPDC048639 TaxID=3365581 RepID=UPI003710A222
MSEMWIGEKVRLRGVERQDWEGFRELAQNTVDARNADLVEPPRSDESFRSWTAECAVRTPESRSFRLVIESHADATFAGALTVGESDPRAGRFKMGIEIVRSQRGQGFAAEATTMILTYMFAEQRYNKCEVEVYAFNDASLALYHKLGFVEEGRLRQHEFFAGRYHDCVLLGITAAEHWATHRHPSLH